MKTILRWAKLAAVTLVLTITAEGSSPRIDPMKLSLSAPISTWDEALPLGNGLLGGLLWGEGGTLRLSLDRGDLWDERPAPGDPLGSYTYAQIEDRVKARDNASILKIADGAYYQDHPTKIPAGRLEIDLAPGQTVTAFDLDLTSATGHARLAGGGAVDAFFSAVAPVALLRVPGGEPKELRLLAPLAVKKIGFPDPVRGTADHEQWFTQRTPEGHVTCVFVGTRREGNATLIATTVTFSPQDGEDVVGAARRQVEAALGAGYAARHAPHAAWWRGF